MEGFGHEVFILVIFTCIATATRVYQGRKELIKQLILHSRLDLLLSEKAHS